MATSVCTPIQTGCPNAKCSHSNELLGKTAFCPTVVTGTLQTQPRIEEFFPRIPKPWHIPSTARDPAGNCLEPPGTPILGPAQRSPPYPVPSGESWYLRGDRLPAKRAAPGWASRGRPRAARRPLDPAPPAPTPRIKSDPLIPLPPIGRERTAGPGTHSPAHWPQTPANKSPQRCKRPRSPAGARSPGMRGEGGRRRTRGSAAGAPPPRGRRARG